MSSFKPASWVPTIHRIHPANLRIRTSPWLSGFDPHILRAPSPGAIRGRVERALEFRTGWWRQTNRGSAGIQFLALDFIAAADTLKGVAVASVTGVEVEGVRVNSGGGQEHQCRDEEFGEHCWFCNAYDCCWVCSLWVGWAGGLFCIRVRLTWWWLGAEMPVDTVDWMVLCCVAGKIVLIAWEVVSIAESSELGDHHHSLYRCMLNGVRWGILFSALQNEPKQFARRCPFLHATLVINKSPQMTDEGPTMTVPYMPWNEVEGLYPALARGKKVWWDTRETSTSHQSYGNLKVA